VHHILTKLDLRSRVDIARRAAELGLAPWPARSAARQPPSGPGAAGPGRARGRPGRRSLRPACRCRSRACTMAVYPSWR